MNRWCKQMDMYCPMAATNGYCQITACINMAKPMPICNSENAAMPYETPKVNWKVDGMIPVEWIYKWLENIPNNWRGYADDWNYNIESEVKKIVYKNNTVILLPCITDMLDDWMEENK